MLEEMRTNYTRYLLDGGDEPSWKEVVADSSQDALASMALRGSLALAAPGLPAAGGQQQLSTAQQQARAAEKAAVAERQRLAGAAGKLPAADELDTNWVSDRKWADMSAKERADVNAKRDATREAAAQGVVGIK